VTRVFILFGALLVAAAVVARADRYEVVAPRAPLAQFPMRIADWQGVQQEGFTKDVLDVLKLDDYLTRAYIAPDRSVVGLYIGFWQSQRQGETIHSPLNCLPGGGWEPTSQSIVPIGDRTPSSGVPTMNRLVIQKGLERQLVLYWYQSHGRMVASEYWSKFYLVTDAVKMNRTDGAIVRVIAPIVGDGPEAIASADRSAMGFVKDLLPQLEGFLPV
jgi:EpsI family protein